MNVILTGCDSNTEWQLPWFIEKFKKYCRGTDCKLAIADFGMTTEAYTDAVIQADYVIDFEGEGGWFNKVRLFNHTHTVFGEDANICWMDTDCEMRRCPHAIFNHVEDNKLSMVVDHPWTEKGSPWTPQGDCGPWYNTGVVAYRGRPLILHPWMKECQTGNHRGDQEALYYILNQDPMKRPVNIVEVSHRYNVLRLDLLQERVPDDPCIVHWTGQKGKDEIRRQMSK